MLLCAESIYQAIYRADSALVHPPVVLAPACSPLRTDRDHRRAHMAGRRQRVRFTGATLSVHDRPFSPEDRSESGHWEGDLIVGSLHRSGIGTLVERQTRYVKLIHVPRQDSETLRAALLRDLGGFPKTVRRSITWDQGTEMARHTAISERWICRCTSATQDRPGSAAATRTPTACSASTSRKGPTCRPTARPTCCASRTNSTSALESSSDTKLQQRCSRSC